MTTYAAYDNSAIYALGETPDAAIQNARNAARDPDAAFQTAPISEQHAADIEEYGFNGNCDTWEIINGFIVPTITGLA